MGMKAGLTREEMDRMRARARALSPEERQRIKEEALAPFGYTPEDDGEAVEELRHLFRIAVGREIRKDTPIQ